MLNGIDPIVIFQFYKLTPSTQATLAKIPIIGAAASKLTFAVVPIYLSESLTGLYIDSESKSIDIETKTDSLTDGSPALVNQKSLGSITTINLKARSDSLGLTVLLAMAELILDKVTSQEYEITYMHGATTVFGGLLHGIQVDQGGNDDMYRVQIQLSRGRQKAEDQTSVAAKPDAQRLKSTGTLPAAGAQTTPPAAGPSSSVIVPRQL